MRSFQRALLRTCAAFATRSRSPRVHSAIVSSSTNPTRLFATENFRPSSPPGTHGTPVFPDIDFSTVSEESVKRNQDPHAVFVVTGANRGIGLQFVKALTTKTQASESEHGVETERWHGFTQYSFTISGKDCGVLSKPRASNRVE